MRTLVCIMASVVLTLPAGGAWGGDARCLWNKLSPSARDKMQATFKMKRSVAYEITEAEVHRLYSGCLTAPVGTDTAKSVAAALQGFVAENGAADELRMTQQVSRDALNRGWDLLEPGERASVRDAGWSVVDGKSEVTRETLVSILTAAMLAGWEKTPNSSFDEPELNMYMFHYMGRALREVAEPKF